MENTCLDWLIALTYDYQLLGALAIAPNDQKLGIVSVHQQYLSVLAELEQESALQAGYTHCPMTSLPYANMTAEFRSVTDLLMQSIAEGNLGGNQIPSQYGRCPVFRLQRFLRQRAYWSSPRCISAALDGSVPATWSDDTNNGIDLSPHMYLPLCLGDEVQVQVMVPLIGGYWADDKLLSSATSLMGGHDGARFAIGDTHIETQVLLAQSTSFPF
ncbi:hypothetical protein B0H14DRAFT_3657202 [Mycena olivaceomarginata]|nr:hypothetical protein B0H14DRAFT_3657202 [Mycena olivaceomarginata]